MGRVCVPAALAVVGGAYQVGRVWSRSPAGIFSALDLLPVMISGAGYPLRVSRPAVGSGLRPI